MSCRGYILGSGGCWWLVIGLFWVVVDDGGFILVGVWFILGVSGWWWIYFGWCWVVVYGGEWWWMVVGGGTVYNSPLKIIILN